MIPFQYKIIGYVVICISIFFFGYFKGSSYEQHKIQKEQISNLSKIIKQKEQQHNITEKVVTQYVDRIKIVKEKADTIIKEIPVYVTQDNDNQCIVPDGFRLLWNASNRGETVSEASRYIDENPNNVVLSDIARQHSKESENCRETEQQLIHLQDWVREQYENQPK